MIPILVKTAAFCALLALASSYNTNRRGGDEQETNRKMIPSDINKWFIVIEDLKSKGDLNFTLLKPKDKDRVAETTETPDFSNKIIDPDPVSVVWYLGAFGGLILFFIIVTFSEWCCASKNFYSRQTYPTQYEQQNQECQVNCAPQTPPPPYHLFAPPPYEFVSNDKTKPIFVISNNSPA